MATLNEIKWAAMEVDGATLPKLNEREHEWLTIQGVSPGGTLGERWYELFGGTGEWNEDAHAWLTAQGVPYGPPWKLNERFYRYWLGEILIPPPPLDNYDPLETHPDWTVVGGPSTLEWSFGEVIQDATAAPECLVYMNGSGLAADVIGQFRVLEVPLGTANATFNIAVRATDHNNFTGLRVYDGEFQLWERAAGVFTQIPITLPRPIKGMLVQLIVQGNAAIVRINGVNFKPTAPLTRLGTGYVGIICRSATDLPYFVGNDYGYALLTAQITFPDLTLTVGNNGGNVHGFVAGSFGSIVPDQTSQGDNFVRITVNNANGNVRLRVNNNYPPNAFTAMEIVGVGTLNAADAVYSNPAGDSLWVWNGTGFSITDGAVYAVDFV